MEADKSKFLHGPLQATKKIGSELFHSPQKNHPLGITVADFWAWSVSDLISNATRGRLAEFIVAKALVISTDGVRNEWGAFDLITPSKLKIEVKSAGYVQAWAQRELSSIIFQVRKSRAWDPETNLQSKDSILQADIYVFALLAERDWKKIDPLNVDQWQFYILPAAVLNERTRSQHSITLKTLQTLSEKSLSYFELNEAVKKFSDGHRPPLH
jgi:hypothetical protein